MNIFLIDIFSLAPFSLNYFSVCLSLQKEHLKVLRSLESIREVLSYEDAGVIKKNLRHFKKERALLAVKIKPLPIGRFTRMSVCSLRHLSQQHFPVSRLFIFRILLRAQMSWWFCLVVLLSRFARAKESGLDYEWRGILQNQ